MSTLEAETVERAIKTIGSRIGYWPDTVHTVTIDHTYGPDLEYVKALCGRRGTGKTAYPSSARCKKCDRVKANSSPIWTEDDEPLIQL